VLATYVWNKTQGSALNHARFTNRASGSLAFTPLHPPRARASESYKVQNFAQPVGEWDEANENPRHHRV
jgi:hypothetical protein